jgi:hypothetical protein
MKAVTLLSLLILSAWIPTAKANIIYEFDVSDTAWAVSYEGWGDFSDTQYQFEFVDNADLNALDGADLVGMAYIHNGLKTAFTASQIEIIGDINEFFGSANAVTTLYVGGYYDTEMLIKAMNEGINNTTLRIMQIGQGYSNFHLENSTEEFYDGFRDATRYTNAAWGYASAQTNYSTIGIVGNLVNVNEPATLAIFALGLMGLVSRRFKKQS